MLRLYAIPDEGHVRLIPIIIVESRICIPRFGNPLSFIVTDIQSLRFIKHLIHSLRLLLLRTQNPLKTRSPSPCRRVFFNRCLRHYNQWTTGDLQGFISSGLKSIYSPSTSTPRNHSSALTTAFSVSTVGIKISSWKYSV